jgi:hypothetical protein
MDLDLCSHVPLVGVDGAELMISVTTNYEEVGA